MNRHRTAIPGVGSSRRKFHRIVAAVLVGAAAHLATAGAARAAGIMALTGCGTANTSNATNILAPNDDGYTSLVPIGFSMKFGASSYTDLYVANNGYVTFNMVPYPWAVPFSVLSTDRVVIAPFRADLDSRSPSSDVVTYSQTTYGLRPAFCVNWAGTGLGYFDTMSDKRNKFQLVLVDRSDVAAGDFDMYMNYDQLQGDGTSPGSHTVGFTGGTPESTFQNIGTALPDYFLDSSPTGLIYGAQNGLTAGQHLFEVRNGVTLVGAQITGVIHDPDDLPVAFAPFQVCDTSGTDCFSGITDAQGNYSVSGLANNIWVVEAFPPEAWVTWALAQSGPITISGGASVGGVDLSFVALAGTPVGTTLSPFNSSSMGIPTVYWQSPLTLSTNGCTGGTATYAVMQGSTTIASGTMAESPAGTYAQPVAPFYPSHGYIKITITLSGCTDGSPKGITTFNAYIDPSGLVHNTHGAPVQGATMTLYRSNLADGLFEPVPDGSPIMAPSNRQNPSFTDAVGHFGWDVMAGYYLVRAEKAGCVSPADPWQPYVDTDVLPVPPEWTNLDLILDCDGTTPPVITAPASFSAEATSAGGAVVNYSVAATDDVDSSVSVICAPASGSTFPIGVTSVVCSAIDAGDNFATVSFDVAVGDATAPVLIVPAELSIVTSSNAGQVVTYAASATDAVDGAITPGCSPASGSLFPLGSTAVLCGAGDSSGNTATATFEVNVSYAWSGFLPPINPNGTSKFKAGSTVPVKFTLDDDSAGVSDATARLYFAPVHNGVPGAEVPADSPDHSNDGNVFHHGGGAGAYHFNWSTKGLAPGTYQVRVDLSDAVLRVVLVTLRK